MNYRYLGKTGLKVSELCLGAMTFGRETSEEYSHQILDRFMAAGGNFVDTADVQLLMANQPVGVRSIDRSFASSRGNSSGLVSYSSHPTSKHRLRSSSIA
jgi:hypothetical protein